MNAKPENNNVANENQSQDAGALQDLPIRTLTEEEADYAEEVKGGIKKAVLFVRKAGSDQQEY